ncbi:MAG: hypothetical protein DRP47_05190, partial [Candidatus Zixiibacteriota bacterium]
YFYDKYIQGEKIEWLSYAPHTLTQAREELFISGPLYPFLLAIIFWLAPLADFTFVRILGILFDLGANLLLMIVGIRLVGRLPALLAGLAYAVYFPFVLSSTLVLLDTSTIFWMLLTLYLLIRATEGNSRAYLFWAGVVSGLLTLNKPTAMLLAIPLIAGLYFYVRKKWPPALFIKRMLWYAAPLAVIVAGWVTVTSVHYGQLAVRNPSYAASNLRQSTSIEFEGYDLDIVEDDFWSRSITKDIIADPIGFVGLIVKKFDRMWRRPYNDFKRSLVLPWQADEVMHLILVFFGLAGLLLLSRLEFGLVAWLVFIIGYYTVIHLVFHSNSRYNLNAMPLVFLAAGHFVALLWSSWQQDTVNKGWRLAGALVLLLAAWQFKPDWVNAVFNTGVSHGMVIACLVLKSGLLSLGLLLLGKILVYDGCPRGRLLLILGSTAVICVTGWTMTLARNNWSEFECRLTNPHQVAGTRLYISELPVAKDGEIFAVAVDINTDYGPDATFVLSAGSTEQRLSWEDIRLKKMFYPKPVYQHYAYLIPLGAEAFRQYVIMPVADSLIREYLDRYGYLDIKISLEHDNETDNGWLSLWGNYSCPNDSQYIPGIRFTSINATSIERFIHEEDPRIHYPVKCLSDSTISYYISNDQDIATGKDLSPTPGVQLGRYNMFLLYIKPDSDFLIY